MKRSEMNKIVKSMSANQNKNTKLNAGQMREAVNLFMLALMDVYGQRATKADDKMLKPFLKKTKKTK
jgi:hypothetical protein